MHTCCAPCSVYCIRSLREEGIEPVAYWFNPNIHPYQEYKTRRDTLIQYAKMIHLNLILEENYGLNEFCKQTSSEIENRCIAYCYRIRLEKTAQYAKQNGYDAFTTTLLVSPYQKHEEIKKIAEEIAKTYQIEFLYRDFRPGFREGQAEAKNLGLYMQKYCGCIFSIDHLSAKRKISDQKKAMIHNHEIEKKIRMSREVSGLEVRPYKNGKTIEMQFIEELRKEIYQANAEKVYGEWNQENQKKLFAKFIKENGKRLEMIYLQDNLVGFFYKKNKDGHIFEIGDICLKPEFQNIGIEKAILKEILWEQKNES